MKTTTRSGFSTFELLIVIVTLMLFAAALVLCLNRPPRYSCRIGCANNLKQVGLAFRTWALDNNDKYPMGVSTNQGGTMEIINAGYAFPHFQVMSNELSTPKILMCPEETDSWRILATTFATLVPTSSLTAISFTNDNNLSYFVGVDATDVNPTMILTGDHWMRIGGKPAAHGLHTFTSPTKVAWSRLPPAHKNGGNVGLGDGSVQQATSADLSKFFLNQNTNQCRLAFP